MHAKTVSAICNYVVTHRLKKMTLEEVTLITNLLRMARETATSNYRRAVIK